LLHHAGALVRHASHQLSLAAQLCQDPECGPIRGGRSVHGHKNQLTVIEHQFTGRQKTTMATGETPVIKRYMVNHTTAECGLYSSRSQYSLLAIGVEAGKFTQIVACHLQHQLVIGLQQSNQTPDHKTPGSVRRSAASLTSNP